MPLCLIGLGANIGDRHETFRSVLDDMAAHAAIKVVKQSSWQETRSAGGPVNQAAYLNGTVLIESALPPMGILQQVQAWERKYGRMRRERWGPRRLDLDLLLYDELTLTSAELTIPHPRFAFRRFVLEPAAGIAGEFIHPTVGWSVNRLLENLSRRPDYIAITGAPGCGRTWVARQAVRRLGGIIIEDQAEELLTRHQRLSASEAGHIEKTLLNRRTQALTSARCQQATTPVISDFWIEESLATWQVAPDSSGQDAGGHGPLSETWNSLRSSPQRASISPKLVVVLRGSLELLTERIRESGCDHEQTIDKSWIASWYQALDRQLNAIDVGPVLALDAAQLDWAVEEVTAAAIAMS